MARWLKVGRAAQLRPGQMGTFDADGYPLLLANVDGEYCALEDTCTHDGGPLAEGELEGREIVCPRHGARFDACTGAVLKLPAFEPVPAFPVRVEDGDILVEVDW